MTRKLGYIPDAPDRRDEVFSTPPNQDIAPAAMSLRSFVGPILDQNPLEACVNNAYAQGRRLIERRNDPMASEWPELISRLAGHYNSRAQHGGTDTDGGTYCRTTVHQANKLGHVRESLWPYDPKQVNVRPPLSVYQVARDDRETNYYRIFQEGFARRDPIRQAISRGMPILFGTSVGHRFLSLTGHELIGKPAGESIAGGHAMLGVGYNEKGLEIVNSWGTGWGDGGYGRLSWEYVEWVATRDIWVLDF